MNSLWVNIDQWGHNMWPTTHGMPWPHGIPLGELCTPSAPRLLCHRMSQLCPTVLDSLVTTVNTQVTTSNHQLSLLPVTHLSQSGAWLAATFAQKLVWEFHTLKVMLKWQACVISTTCVWVDRIQDFWPWELQSVVIYSPQALLQLLWHGKPKMNSFTHLHKKSGPEDRFSHGI